MTDNIDLTSTAALAAAIDNPPSQPTQGGGETVTPEAPVSEQPSPAEPTPPTETPAEAIGEQPVQTEEPALTPEEEAGIMLRADYTRKTQALAEQRKQFEEERRAFEAERAALLAGAPDVKADAQPESSVDEAAQTPASAAEALTSFKFEPLAPFVVPDDADEETVADFAAANRQVEAINKAGEFAAQSAPLLAQALEFNSRMYEYIQIAEANAEFERTKVAMDEKYQGFDLTVEQFAQAMIAELGDPKTVPPFFFEGWKNRTAEQRRNTIEKQFGPDILKRIKDKAQSDKEIPPTPPKTLDAPTATSQPPEQIDWTNTKAVREYLDRKG